MSIHEVKTYRDPDCLVYGACMHILVLSQQWAPEHGILQRRMTWLVEGLHRAGHTVSVVTAPPHYPSGKLLSSDPQYQPGVVAKGLSGETIYRTGYREHSSTVPTRFLDEAWTMLASCSVISKAVSDKRPDLIIATAPPLPSVIEARCAYRLHHIPYVIDLRDPWPDLAQYIAYTDPALPHPTLTRRAGAYGFKLLGKVLAAAMQGSDGILTTSFSLAEELSERWGVRTHVLRNLAQLPDVRVAELREAGPDDPLKVVYAGTIGRAQGLHVVLDAVEILKERSVPIEVVLQGRGAHAYYIQTQAEVRNLPVKVQSFVPREHVSEIFDEADTLLLTFQNWEALRLTVPSKLFEMIASGKHITGMVFGEAADLIRASGTGDVVPVKDAVALADLWENLQADRSKLDIGDAGLRWFAENIDAERELTQAISFLEATVS